MIKSYSMRSKVIDFFERLPNFELRKPQLYLILIGVEVLGILVLVWYLRTPLSQKYLTVSSRTYNVSDLNQTARYLLTEGDFLVGKTTVSNKLVLLVRDESDQSFKVKARVPIQDNGAWFYKIPSDFKAGKYRLTVGVFDVSNQIVGIDTYKLNVLNSNVLKNSRDIKEFWAYFSTPKTAEDNLTPSEGLPEGIEIEEISNTVKDIDINLNQTPGSDYLDKTDKPLLDN